MNTASQLELFEPGEYLDTRRKGYFSILQKPEPEKTVQHSYPVSTMPIVITALDRRYDSYISQALFDRKNRRTVNVESIALFFVDLDLYKIAEFANRSPDDMVNLVLGYCIAEDLSLPSLIMFSGRGLQVKWFLDEPLYKHDLIVFNQVQSALVHIFTPLGSDPNAKDISRVLRIDQTMNTKSGLKAEVVHITQGADGSPVKYALDDLFPAFTGKKVQSSEIPASGGTQKAIQRSILRTFPSFTVKTLNWARLNDIRRLWDLRGGVPVGYREVTLFWELNFLVRADPSKSDELYKEAEELARQISGQKFYRNSDLSSLFRKAKENANGESVEYKGKRYSPLYTPRNDTLIDIFQITPEEEAYMKTIISKDEKYRRKVVKRREAGIVPREDYEGSAISRLKPWEAEGVSRATWYNRKRAREEAKEPLKATPEDELYALAF